MFRETDLVRESLLGGKKVTFAPLHPPFCVPGLVGPKLISLLQETARMPFTRRDSSELLAFLSRHLLS